jgi:uncharacterized protein YidB (DUF937 family)
MTALLGLLAVAGYQNRDKLAEMIGDRTGTPGDLGHTGGAGQTGGLGQSGGLGQLLAGFTGGAAGGGLSGLLNGGLSELSDRFRQNGQGDAVESWVSTGPNREVQPRDLEQAIGVDVLDDLEQQTGMRRDEILARLSRELPRAVDDFTPEGRLPDAHA